MIAPYGALRAALNELARPLGHPTKGVYTYGLHEGQQHKYGRVVYREGGEVGLLTARPKRYLIARGTNHEDSVRQLAYELQPVVKDKDGNVYLHPNVGVQVDEVDAGHFWLFTLPEGYTLPEE